MKKKQKWETTECAGDLKGHQVNLKGNLKFRIHIVGHKQLQEPMSSSGAQK